MKKPAVFKSMEHVMAYINRDLSKDGEEDEKWPVGVEAMWRSRRTKKYDFGGCRFECKVNFFNYKFTEIVDFNLSTFLEEACFKNSAFSEEANFRRSFFLGEADFSGAGFEKKADFFMIKSMSINFYNASFLSLFHLDEAKINI